MVDQPDETEMAVMVELPALSAVTDVSYKAEPQSLEMTLKVGRPVKMMVMALGWAVVLLAVFGALGGAVWWLLRDSDWKLLGGFLFLPGWIGGLCFFLFFLMIPQRKAEVRLTSDQLVVREQHMGTSVEVVVNLSDVVAVGQGWSAKKELLFGEGISEQQCWYGLRFGRKAELVFDKVDHVRMGVLVGWERPDLAWLAEVVRQRWNLLPLVDEPWSDAQVVNLSVEKMHEYSSLGLYGNLWLIGLMIVLGVAFPAMLLPSTWRGWQSEHWPQTTGKVQAASYVVRGTDGHESYTVKAAYVFELSGQSYAGDTVSYAYPDGEDNVRQLIEPLRPGDAVTVYYDPDDPRRNVLINGMPTMGWFVFVLPVLCFGMAVWLWRKRRRIQATRAQWAAATGGAQAGGEGRRQWL
ncbi:MAG: DUF3592 domain-containing protein [Phycisphaeraceae bacterium]|nr:DUF3592 domain-containing protein [Phycisphaeraceae bacterium]